MHSEIIGEPKKFDSLKDVALAHAADPVALDKSLKDLDTLKNTLGDVVVRAKQVAALYDSLRKSNPQQFEYLLYKHKVISGRRYFWYAKEWRSKTTAIAVAVVLIIAAGVAIKLLGTAENYARYYVWRLHKDNGTDYDRFRARKKLTVYLATTPAVYVQLTNLLRLPNLPVKTADNILGLLLETRQIAASRRVDLEGSLTESLRTGDSDIRSRIQKELLYLADERKAVVPSDLRAWQPDPKNTVADLDQIVKQWRQIK